MALAQASAPNPFLSLLDKGKQEPSLGAPPQEGNPFLSLLDKKEEGNPFLRLLNRPSSPTPIPVSPATVPGPPGRSADPLVSTLQQAGFQGDALRTAWAIAKRESGGRATAFNPDRSTGDQSYGLFQINMLGKLGPDRRARYGLASNEALLDPATNARVAYAMSKGGTDFGAWGIGPHAYRQMPALNFAGFPGASTLPWKGQQPSYQTLPYNPATQAPQYQTLSAKQGKGWDFGSAASWTGGGSNLGGPQAHYAKHDSGENWESNDAWDIGVPIGTPIYAQEDGVVGSNIGVQASRPNDGMRVSISGQNDYWLGHLSRLAVRAGQRVRRGDLIGYSGASQNGAAHLHIARRGG